jgi:hypothetical protein
MVNNQNTSSALESASLTDVPMESLARADAHDSFESAPLVVSVSGQ